MNDTSWLTITRGAAPLLLSLPHTGTMIPPEYEAGLVSPRLARKDADWWVDRLYDFAGDLGATVVRTAISRTGNCPVTAPGPSRTSCLSGKVNLRASTMAATMPATRDSTPASTAARKAS